MLKFSMLHVYEDRLQTSLLPRARTSHSKFHHCSGLIEIGRIRQPLDQKFFLASIQPPGLLESLMLDVLMSTFDSVLSSFATSLYSFQSIASPHHDLHQSEHVFEGKHLIQYLEFIGILHSFHVMHSFLS